MQKLALAVGFALQFREMGMFRRQGKWGCEQKECSNPWISIAADRDQFISEFTRG